MNEFITHTMQMSVIDEKQESIACIRMAIDNNDLAQRLNADAPDDEELHPSRRSPSHIGLLRWLFGLGL
jgi:hypothetical protein